MLAVGLAVVDHVAGAIPAPTSSDIVVSTPEVAVGTPDTDTDTDTDTPTEQAPAAQPDDAADRFLTAFRENFGETDWGMTVTGARVQTGNLYLTAQIDRTTDEETAQEIQRGAINLLNTGGLGTYTWVIVEDGTGTVVTQGQVD